MAIKKKPTRPHLSPQPLAVGPASFYYASTATIAVSAVRGGYLAAREEAFEAALATITLRLDVEALFRGYVDVVTDLSHAPGCLGVNGSPLDGRSDALRNFLTNVDDMLLQGSEIERTVTGSPRG